MIPTEAYLQKIRALPPLMKAILNNEAFGEAIGELEEKYLLSPEQTKALLIIQSSIIGQEYSPDQIYPHIKELLKLGDPIAQQITVDFLGTIVVPMQWFVGNVEQLIRGFGGDPSSFVREAQRKFPELSAGTATPNDASPEERLIDDMPNHLATFAGRAEVLLRLTGLSATIEDLMNAEYMSREEGERLIADLETISSAINTHDLNPFEIQTLQRRTRRVIEEISEAKQ